MCSPAQFKNAFLAFNLLFMGLPGLGANTLGKEQIWRSADGRKIAASVLELNLEEASVKMKRADGFVFSIDFDQFAAADADRLRAAAHAEQSSSNPEPEAPEDAEQSSTGKLPDDFELKKVPMVRQKGNFCVPASATMIAGFHGIETDQDQIAFLSSAQSFGNQGTSPNDMVLAMRKLGFEGQPLYWKNPTDFDNKVLPAIRKALVQEGPIYISFGPGVFGDSGHGCVIIGYHDRKEELTFHNPWGNVFTKDYIDVARQARGIVILAAPAPAPIASDAFIEKIQSSIPKFTGKMTELPRALAASRQPHELVWCSRRDARDDKRFAVDTARDDGRKILSLAFRRNPAVLLPANNRKGETEKYYFVTRPLEGARFWVREIRADGWTEPELFTLGSITRVWPTRIESGPEKFIWELPMIELHPED